MTSGVNGSHPELANTIPTVGIEPPHDQDAERAVLGAVLGQPRLIEQVRHLGREMFYHHSRQAIYDTLIHLTDAGRAVNLMSVTDAVAVAHVGRRAFVRDVRAELDQCYRWADNAVDYPHFAERVARAHRRRQLLAIGAQITQLATLDLDTDVEDRVTAIAQDMFDGFDTPISKRTDRFPRLDWTQAWHTDYTIIDWLPGRLLERGQQVALVGDGKAGKSLFTLDWMWHAVSGQGFLGDTARDPIDVLYFDRENNQADIITRGQALGARPDQLDRLDYRLFPRFSGALDASNTAALEFFAIVDERPRSLVVLDTVSRFIAGEENDSATWLQLYARIHAELKRRGIAAVRLDHFGKDTTRGARGNSAKTQDVDHVWELSAAPPFVTRSEHHEHHQTRVLLKRTHTRTGRGDDVIHIVRHGSKDLASGQWMAHRTRHDATSTGHTGPVALDDHEPGSVEWIAAQLDAHGVDPTWGRDRVSAWCAEKGIRGSKDKFAQVVRLRKEQTNMQETLPAP